MGTLLDYMQLGMVFRETVTALQSNIPQEFMMYCDLWAILILMIMSYSGLICFWVYLNLKRLSFDEYVMLHLIRNSPISTSSGYQLDGILDRCNISTFVDVDALPGEAVAYKRKVTDDKNQDGTVNGGSVDGVKNS